MAIAKAVFQTTCLSILRKAYCFIGPARLIGGKGDLKGPEPVEAGNQGSPSCCTNLDKFLDKALIPPDILKTLVGLVVQVLHLGERFELNHVVFSGERSNPYMLGRKPMAPGSP